MFKEALNSVEPIHMVQNVLHYDKKVGQLTIVDKVCTWAWWQRFHFSCLLILLVIFVFPSADYE
jgi:hypothetical protein